MLDVNYEPGLLASPAAKIFASFSLFIVILFSTFCWYYWKLMKSYRKFPSKHLDVKWIFKIVAGLLPKDIPITAFVFQEIIKECKRFQDEGSCVLWFIRPYLLIFNGDFYKTFFNETAVISKGSIYVWLKDLLGNGLILSEEEIWKNHRKLVNPAFNLGVLKGNMHIFNENGYALTEKLQAVVDKPTDNALHVLKHCAFNIIAESVLGLNMKDVKCGSKAWDFMENIDQAAAFFVYRIASPWLNWNFLLPLFPSGRKYMKRIYDIHHFTDEIIEELKKTMNESEKEEINLDEEKEIDRSFAQILIGQHLRDPKFTALDVRDHLINIMAGGFDTTSLTLMWCFYLLGNHPNEQEKVFEEISSVVPVGDVSYNDLAELKYLDCIIKETLRLYPVVPLYIRKVKRDVQCGQYTVPKGSELVFCTFLLLRNPDIYPDPERFHPERFSEAQTIRPWLHTPFAEGYRYCIGKRFAMMEMKVLLVHVLRRFKITSLNTISDTDLDYAIVLKATKQLRFLFTSR